MLKLLVLLIYPLAGMAYVAPSDLTQYANCGCLCVEGVAKTLCKSLDDARVQGNVCALDIICPEPPGEQLPRKRPLRFEPPAAGAHNCREVRIWDRVQLDYTGVKVCDVLAG